MDTSADGVQHTPEAKRRRLNGDGAAEVRPPAADAPLPADTLASFVSSLDEYTPTIPQAVMEYFMAKSGVQTDDERMYVAARRRRRGRRTRRGRRRRRRRRTRRTRRRRRRRRKE